MRRQRSSGLSAVGSEGSPVKLDRDDAFWEALADRPWRRVKWRRSDGDPPNERCIAYDLPIHRKGTYYLRPAYTDGEAWLCQQAYDELVRRTAGHRPSRRYSQPPEEDPGA